MADAQNAQQVLKMHDRMLWSTTTIGKYRFKNAILMNLKETRYFYSIWNISFVSVVMAMCLFLWVFNPDTYLPLENPHGEENAEVCVFDVNCSRRLECWDNKHTEATVFMPPGYYPTEAVSVEQDQEWNADKAQYFNVTNIMTQWFMLGFFLEFFHLANEIFFFCCWSHNKEKIYDVHTYNRT